MSFAEFGLDQAISKALADCRHTSPTAIQQKCIPAMLTGDNVFVSAPTGTGKTASYVIPLLQKYRHVAKVRGKRVRSLILVPTRELAEQVFKSVQLLGAHLDVSACLLIGGVDSEPQKRELIEGQCIVVATPGRILDLVHQRALYFEELTTLVIDEADRMLDMGFYKAIMDIIERLPMQRQNGLFSATLNESVRDLASFIIPNAKRIDIAPKGASKPAIEQWATVIDKDKKSALLAHLITTFEWQQALIFVGTKHGVAKLADQLGKRGINAETLHSGRSQASRNRVIEQFKSEQTGLLIATDIASRGIDIAKLSRVVNYDLPDDVDEYIHRIGRTGRANASGEAVTFVSRDDAKRFFAAERRIGQIIERRVIDGFVVSKDIPPSNLNYLSKHRKK